jgi:hypothetical protein
LKWLERKRGRYEFLNSKWLGINPLNAKLNPICHLLALLGAHHILHVSRIWFNNGLAYSKIMICADVMDLSSSWELLHKGRCKWEKNLRTVE